MKKLPRELRGPWYRDRLEALYAGDCHPGFDVNPEECRAVSGSSGRRCKHYAMYGNLCQVHYRMAELNATGLRIIELNNGLPLLLLLVFRPYCLP